MKLVNIGSVFLGLSVYHGIGVFGFGSDKFFELLVFLNVTPIYSEILSRVLLGILSVAAIFLITRGYHTERYGIDINLHAKNLNHNNTES